MRVASCSCTTVSDVLAIRFRTSAWTQFRTADRVAAPQTATVIGPDGLRARGRAPVAHDLPVLLTFDDGNRDYYDLAYPVLKAVRVCRRSSS